MGQRITAVMENGLLRPTQPLELAEGGTVELEVIRRAESAEARVRAWNEALQEFWDEGDQLPQEWWDDYERGIQEDRLTFQERV
jgi:predicted DNA-binding antitoxin AbrB/MazE fold protein